MRSNEERVAAVKRRSKELERENGKRRGRIVSISSIVACLALIVGLSFYMPGVVENFSYDTPGYSSMTASVFQNNSALGYISIGLLAFALGMCVTVLCYQTQRSERAKKANNSKREKDDD